MNRLKYGVQVFLGCALVYAAGCGGSTSPGDTGDTGSAGSKGSFAGATAASAGYSSTNTGGFNAGDPGDVGGSPTSSDPGSTGVAGSETSAGGDMSSGGSSTTVGSGTGGTSVSSSGAVGAGGQSSCPAAAPTNSSMCSTVTPTGENCLYVGESCACRAPVVIGPRPGAGAGGAGSGAGGASVGAGGAAAAEPTWRCTGSGAACPTTTPKTGDMCTNATGAGGAGAGIGAAALDCPYPDGSTCRCTNRRWECTEPPPPACPKTQPTGACSAVQACTYGTAAMRIRCECDGKAWACDMAGGAAPRCTAKARAALATGDTCTGIGECPATGTTTKTCVCDGKTVTCN